MIASAEIVDWRQHTPEKPGTTRGVASGICFFADGGFWEKAKNWAFADGFETNDMVARREIAEKLAQQYLAGAGDIASGIAGNMSGGFLEEAMAAFFESPSLAPYAQGLPNDLTDPLPDGEFCVPGASCDLAAAKERFLEEAAYYGEKAELGIEAGGAYAEGLGKKWERWDLWTLAKKAFFIATNPVDYWDIGSDWSSDKLLKGDITTASTNFFLNSHLKRGQAGDGNAYRHALWSAMMVAEIDHGTAEHAGNAHESSNAIPKDLAKVRIKDLDDADRIVDLLNNKIGRKLGSTMVGKSRRTIADATLLEFRKNGLYVAVETKDGYKIERRKLSSYKYYRAINRFRRYRITDNGISAAAERRIRLRARDE